MANIKSQIKRNRQNVKRRMRNRSVRSEINTRSAGAEAAARAGEEDAAEKLRMAVKRIDSAAAKGVLHSNTASRKKSRNRRHTSSKIWAHSS
ncbi:MAG: 30S ribosomal protein S20, partial [bacterium]|nr:30S ribosomal protein S20 [bacterium]